MDNRSPKEIVTDALTVLESFRDPEGDLPETDIETYLFLYEAWIENVCEDWKVLSVAKLVLMRVTS